MISTIGNARERWSEAPPGLEIGVATGHPSLATAIHGLASKGLRKFVVTSSTPCEGKSFVTAEAGRALARLGRESVVLVDADQVDPTLHVHFGLRSDRGLSELLREVYLSDLTHEDPFQFGVGDWLEILRGQQRTGELAVREGAELFSLAIVKGLIGG